MRTAVIVIVVLGFGLTGALALIRGLDLAGAIIFASVIATGTLAIAIARKAGGGSVAPAECRACGGLVSPNAPYCKHCGADLVRTA